MYVFYIYVTIWAAHSVSSGMSIRVVVGRIFVTLVIFWVMFILWMKDVRAVLVTAWKGNVFSILSGFIILIYAFNLLGDLLYP